MTEEEAVTFLRSQTIVNSPIFLLSALIDMSRGDLKQFDMIRYFKEAFPTIPLQVLIEASTSRLLVGDTGMSDSDFDKTLKPWFHKLKHVWLSDAAIMRLQFSGQVREYGTVKLVQVLRASWWPVACCATLDLYAQG